MKKLFLLLSAIFLFLFSFADEICIPKQPSPPQLVNILSKEFPDFLSGREAGSLEQKLSDFNDSTSTQIVIVVVDDLCGYDANEFSTRLGRAWGVGQGKFDNGIVIMIKPTGGEGHRDAYIAVGNGLESVIPDITAKKILNNEILPRFKEGNFFDALDASTDVLISLARKEYSYKDYQGKRSEDNWTPFIVFAIVFVFIIFNSFRRRAYTLTSGRRYYGGGWIGGGGWGSSGGSSGGGFSGFGGGSFGGGGSGGNW